MLEINAFIMETYKSLMIHILTFLSSDFSLFHGRFVFESNRHIQLLGHFHHYCMKGKKIRPYVFLLQNTLCDKHPTEHSIVGFSAELNQ